MDTSFAKWLTRNGYEFILLEGCPYCNQLLNSFSHDAIEHLPTRRIKRLQDRPKQFEDYSLPIILQYQNPLIFENSKHELRKIFEKYKKEKGNSFGNKSLPASQKLSPNPKRAPIKGWGSFSYDPRCSYPQSEYYARQGRPKDGKPSQSFGRKRRVSFGQGLFAKQATLPKELTNEWYDKRGNNGFQDRPKTIYKKDGGSVPRGDPYKEVHTGILPRPYGPRDNAAIKYAGQKFGQAPLDEPDQWFPHPIRSWKSGPKTTFANRGLYLAEGPKVNSFGQGREGYMDKKRSAVIYLRNCGLINDEIKRFKLDTWIDQEPTSKRVIEKIKGMMKKNSFGNFPDYQVNRSFQPPMVMYGDPGANTYDRLAEKRYLPPYAPDQPPVQRGYSTPDKKLKVRPNNNPTGWLSNSSVVPVSGTKFGNIELPYHVQPMVVANQEAAGQVGAAQPLDLYKYQNTDYGSYNYPEFLAPRYWNGGFGRKKKKKGNSAKGRQRSSSIGPGDIIEVSRGKINIKKGK